MQNHYNLIYREEEREMLPLCRQMGVGVIPWSPLARGLLAGNRTRDGQRRTERARTDAFADTLYDENDFAVVDATAEVAAERELPPAQVALAWLLSRPGVTAPIVGATRPEHIDDAVAATEVVLDQKEIERLEVPYRPHPISGHV
jgi:aryl-alcohol dehydrogenase-like predicted oxidoreductase